MVMPAKKTAAIMPRIVSGVNGVGDGEFWFDRICKVSTDVAA